MRVSAKFTEYCTRQMIDHLEHLIDQDNMQNLQKISSRIEGLLDSDLTTFKSKSLTAIDTQLLEFAFTPSVQANAHFDLKIGAQGTGKLTADTVIIGIGSKYADMCSSISRTLLIGPS